MSRPSSALLILLAIAVLLTAGFAALTWGNLQWTAHLPPESEFLYRWEITRGLVFEQRNPYQTTSAYHFTAPLPMLALYFPFALLQDYNLARALWMTVSQIAALGFAYLNMRSAFWESNRWVTGAILLLTLLWLPAVSLYALGSEAILMAAFFGGGLLLLQQKRDEAAGVLMTLAALQWTLTWPGILFMLLWAASRRRWTFYFWGAVTFLGSSLLAMVFIPSWPVDFFWATLRFTNFHPGQAVLDITTGWWPGVGEQIGGSIILVGGILLIIEWYLAWGQDSRHLAWTAAFTWGIGIWIGIGVGVGHIFLLAAALVVILSTWSTRWGRGGLAFSLIAGLTVLAVPWWRALTAGAEATRPLLVLGFPLAALLGLYWVRWWFLRATYLLQGEG